MTILVQRSAFLEAIQKHEPLSTAVVNHDDGTSFSYRTLLHDIAYAKERLICSSGKGSVASDRVAFLVENGYDYVGMRRSSLPDSHLLGSNFGRQWSCYPYWHATLSLYLWPLRSQRPS